MKFKLFISFCLVSFFSYASQSGFKDPIMHFNGNYKPQSRWGVFMVLDDHKGSRDRYHRYILASSLSKTGYQLDPSKCQGTPETESFFPPYDAASPVYPAIDKDRLTCHKPKADIGYEDNIPAGQCLLTFFDINSLALINNIKNDYAVVTFGMFPCDAMGTTFLSSWNFNVDTADVETCNGTFIKATNSYCEGKDFTTLRNPYMRYAAVQMMKKETGKQSYLTIADVNNAGQSLFGTLDFTMYFNTVFMLYFSNVPLDAATKNVFASGIW